MMYNRLFLFLFSVLIFTFSFAASAQTQKHNLLVGGNSSYTKRYLHNPNPVTNLPQEIVNNTFYINPTISYFIVDNLAIGISGDFSTNNVLESEDRTKRGDGYSYSLGPIARYYVPFERWAVFSEAQLLKNSGRQHSYFDSDKWTFSNTGSMYKLGIGASYFVTPNVGLEGLLSYSSRNNAHSSTHYPGSPIFVNQWNGVNLWVGAQFYIGMSNKEK